MSQSLPSKERPMSQYFPWKDVEASMRETKLETWHGAPQDYLQEARSCPLCNTAPEKLRWVFVSSPPWTWDQRRGRAGYLLVCDKCRLQVDFFCEVRS